jgi:hypothetical protein
MGTGFVIKHSCPQQQSPCVWTADRYADNFLEAVDNIPVLRTLKKQAYEEATDWLDTEEVIAWEFSDRSVLRIVEMEVGSA